MAREALPPNHPEVSRAVGAVAAAAVAPATNAVAYLEAGVRATHFAFAAASPRLAEADRPLSIICWIKFALALLWIAS
jgi:hypothetical protein